MKNDKALRLMSRALLTGIFISAGISKLRDREGTKKYIESKKLPMASALVKGAIAMELGVAPAMLLGLLPRFSGSLLSAFLIPTTAIFHNPFTEKDPSQRKMQSLQLMKNLAIIGGLISVALHDAERVGSQVSRQTIRLTGERPDYLEDQAG